MRVHEFVDEGPGHSSYVIDRHCLDVGHEHLLGEFDRGSDVHVSSAPDTWATATGEGLAVGR